MPKPTLALVVNQGERRKATRYEVSDMLDGYLSKSQERSVQVHMKDISKNGIAFFTQGEKHAVARGEKVQLDLYIKGSENYFTCEFNVLETVKDKQGRVLHRCQVGSESENATAIEHLAAFVETVRMKKDPSAA